MYTLVTNLYSTQDVDLAGCVLQICEEEDELKHFLLEISWPPEYPHILPAVTLNVFFNKHL